MRVPSAELPEGTRSLAQLDSENLFHGLRGVAPYVVEALEHWLATTMPDPRYTVEYGKLSDRYVRAIQGRASRYHYGRVDAPPGKDAADDALIADLTAWAPLGVAGMIGSGDRGLICRAVEAAHATPSRVAWVVVGPQFPQEDLAQFDGPGLLGAVGTAAVRRIDDVYQRYFGGRLVADGDPSAKPVTRRRTPWGPLPELPAALPWYALHPGHAPLGAPWRRRASDQLRAAGLVPDEADELVSLLAAWLPRFHSDDPDDGQWRWSCFAAACCPAMAPGEVPTELAVALYLHVRGQGDEAARDAHAAAEQLVIGWFGSTRRATLEARYGPLP